MEDSLSLFYAKQLLLAELNAMTRHYFRYLNDVSIKDRSQVPCIFYHVSSTSFRLTPEEITNFHAFALERQKLLPIELREGVAYLTNVDRFYT